MKPSETQSFVDYSAILLLANNVISRNVEKIGNMNMYIMTNYNGFGIIMGKTVAIAFTS